MAGGPRTEPAGRPAPSPRRSSARPAPPSWRSPATFLRRPMGRTPAASGPSLPRVEPRAGKARRTRPGLGRRTAVLAAASGHLLLLGAGDRRGPLPGAGVAESVGRVVRTGHPAPPWRRLWWVLPPPGPRPCSFAAPFASQDVWVYVAQGKLVASGCSSTNPVHLLGHHSQWLSAVDRAI